MFVAQAAELWWRKVLIRVAPGAHHLSLPASAVLAGIRWHMLADQVNSVADLKHMPHQE